MTASRVEFRTYDFYVLYAAAIVFRITLHMEHYHSLVPSLLRPQLFITRNKKCKKKRGLETGKEASTTVLQDSV